MTQCSKRFRWVKLGMAIGLAISARVTIAADFKEVYELLRKNAESVNETELNRAAVDGLLSELSSRAWLVDPSKPTAPETNVAPVSSTALFDENYGYVRIGRVSGLLPEQFSSSLGKLSATNKLKGLVIDLRYAAGTDYDAAAKVADRFLGSEQPLLDWGKGMVKSTDKTNAFRQPVAILVNQFTSGAAEALAAVLRQKDVGLLIGTNTAGQASITKDFPLQGGEVLRIAVAPVKVGRWRSGGTAQAGHSSRCESRRRTRILPRRLQGDAACGNWRDGSRKYCQPERHE